MKTAKPGLRGSDAKARPQEIEPSAAAPRPDEDELEAASVNHTNVGNLLQTAMSEPVGICFEENAPDADLSPVEGWVAGVPVVDGVADSGWQKCEGGRVRLVVRVRDSAEQREWVRAMAYGGAYAREALG
jgi:hypothetical protein